MAPRTGIFPIPTKQGPRAVLYIALGWLVLMGFRPMLAHGSRVALLLLAIGGAPYMSGAVPYVRKKLGWFWEIWHAHVVAAAGVYRTAVLVGWCSRRTAAASSSAAGQAQDRRACLLGVV